MGKSITGVMYGGPFNGVPVEMSQLHDQLILKFDEHRIIVVYSRDPLAELDYVYNRRLSAVFTMGFDQVKDKLPFAECQFHMAGEKKNENLSGGTDAGDTGV